MDSEAPAVRNRIVSSEERLVTNPFTFERRGGAAGFSNKPSKQIQWHLQFHRTRTVCSFPTVDSFASLH